jgi:5-methylcytosine-specific restriction endonuclease McrA
MRSMEHILPRSKGGATEWKNVVLADKRINSNRGNRSLEEVGLTFENPAFFAGREAVS